MTTTSAARTFHGFVEPTVSNTGYKWDCTSLGDQCNIEIGTMPESGGGRVDKTCAASGGDAGKRHTRRYKNYRTR